MYLVSPDYVAGRKQSPTPPTPTTQMPTQQESRMKRIKKKKTTKHGRRRQVTEEQHPYDKWVKMRSEMHEANIERKTIIQKFADFLQKVLPNSNAHPKQTMATAPTPPPLPPPPSPHESPYARAGADLKTETHASPSGNPFLKRESESLFESPIKRSLSTDSEDEGCQLCPERTVCEGIQRATLWRRSQSIRLGLGEFRQGLRNAKRFRRNV